MRKALIYISLSLLGISGLPLLSDSHAEHYPVGASEYVDNPSRDGADAPVYPNPATDHIFVRLDKIIPSMGIGTFDFEIRSILGNSMPVNSERTNTYNYRIDTSDYPAGYYLLVVRCDNCKSQGNSIRKVFKFLKK